MNLHQTKKKIISYHINVSSTTLVDATNAPMLNKMYSHDIYFFIESFSGEKLLPLFHTLY
jgi:hypothetical protein